MIFFILILVIYYLIMLVDRIELIMYFIIDFFVENNFLIIEYILI